MEIIVEVARKARVKVELMPRLAPQTVRALLRALPIQSVAQRWGDEVYFSVPVQADAENAQEIVEKGDVGYWPPGKALCLFFGPTPSSRQPGEIRPASPVNVVGRALDDPRVLAAVTDGDPIEVRLA